MTQTKQIAPIHPFESNDPDQIARLNAEAFLAIADTGRIYKSQRRAKICRGIGAIAWLLVLPVLCSPVIVAGSIASQSIQASK